MRAFPLGETMNCKYEIVKAGGYVDCGLYVPGTACIATKEHPQSECDYFEEEDGT